MPTISQRPHTIDSTESTPDTSKPNIGRRSFLATILGLALVDADAKSQPKIATQEYIAGAIQRLGIKSGQVAELEKEGGKIKIKRSLDGKATSDPAAIASLTKLLTILSVYTICTKQNIDRNSTIEIQEEDQENANKSKNPKIKKSQKFSIDDLIKVALINSNNEAVETLARHLGSKLPGIGNGRDKFIKYMNSIAKSLDMNRSNFDSPSGLSAGNISTPADINTLVLAVYNSPYKIGSLTTKSDGVEIKSQKNIHFRNANRILLETLESDPDFEALIQKTGYIKESGKCVTLMVKNIKNNKIFIVTLFDAGKGHHAGIGDSIRRANVKHILNILRKI